MCANTGFGSLVDSVKKEAIKKEEEDKGAGVGAGEEEEEEGERYVHFSCRIANAAKARGEDPNIIELLHEYAALDPTFLSDLKAAGEEQYARGHRQASGGVSCNFNEWQKFGALKKLIFFITSPPPPPPPSLPFSFFADLTILILETICPDYANWRQGISSAWW